MKKHFSKIFYLSIKPSIFYFIARASNACLVIKEAMNTSTLWINCYTKTDTLKFEDYQEKRNKRIIACKTLPGYLKSDFVERIARLQWGALKEPARAPVDLVAAMHWSGCRLRLVRTIGPTLATLICSASMPLFPYLLRLTAQVVQPEEVHWHLCSERGESTIYQSAGQRDTR